MWNVFKINRKDKNDATNDVLVSLFLTLNMFHTFLLLTLNR